MELNLPNPWFTLVLLGKKTVVAIPGVLDGFHGPIRFRCGNDVVDVEVKKLRYYSNLNDYLRSKWKKAAPQCCNTREAKIAYLSIREEVNGSMIRTFSPENIELKGGIVVVSFIKN